MADHLTHSDLSHEHEPLPPDAFEELATLSARRVIEPDVVLAETMGSRESARAARARNRRLGSQFTSKGPLPQTPQDDVAAMLDGRIIKKN
jgi:hypothetical protein